MSLKVLKSGAWKNITSAKVLKSGAWKNIANGWILKSGAWKKFWPGGDFDLIAGNVFGTNKGWFQSPPAGTPTPNPPYLAGYLCTSCSSANVVNVIGFALYIPGVTVDPGVGGWFTNFLINDSGGTNLLTVTSASASSYTFNSGSSVVWEWSSAFKFVISTSYQIRTT